MRLRSWLLLSVFSVPLFVSLGTSSIWDSNEAFYVQTPREMVQRSDWLVPHFNGQPRLNKPPLSYWLVATAYALFGVSVFWARLLTALCGVAAIVAVFHLGKAMFSPPVGLLGAAIFATTFRFLILSRRALVEILLLALLLWALLALFAWLRRKKPSHLYLAALLLGLGFLTKGPVVLLAPAVFFLFLAVSGRLRLLAAPGLPTAALLFSAVASSWFVALGLVHGWQPVSDFFLQENLGRYLSVDYGPRRGAGYYPGVFLGDFLPWSLPFLISLVWWFKDGRSSAASATRRSMLLLGLWMAAWIVLFSFSHNKQEYYILPVYPAAALWLARYLQTPRYDRIATLPAGLLLLIVSLALAATLSLLLGPALAWWLLVLPGLGFAVLLIRRYWKAAAFSLSVFFVLAFHLVSAPLESYRPVRRLARHIQRLEKGSQQPYQAGYLKLASPSLAFYLDHPVLELFDTEEAARCLASTTRTYLLVEPSDLPGLQASAPASCHVVAASPRLSTGLRPLLEALRSDRWQSRDTWFRQVVLVSNQPTG